MNTVKERIKTVMLAVLVCGAVFMAYSTWFYDAPVGDGAFNLIKGDEYAINGEYPFGFEGAAEIKPMRISVRKTDGRVGAEYSHAETDALYGATRNLMAQALGVQSGKWSVAPDDTWLSALACPGVLYDYQGLVRADVISNILWGGKSDVGDAKGRYVLLAVNPDTEQAEILMKNPDTQQVFRVKTTMPGEAVLEVTEEIQAMGCVLANESEKSVHSCLNPESFIMDSALPGVISGYDVFQFRNDEEASRLIKTFGFTPYSVSEHVEPDGTQVYIDGTATVRISRDGFVVYRDTDASEEMQQGIFVTSAADVPDETDIFDTASELLSRLSALVGGEGRLYPRDFRYFEDEGCWVADFGWSVNGVPVDRHDTGYSARVVISNLRVVEAGIHMRSYQSTDKGAPLPGKDLAAATSAGENYRLELRYTDVGAGEVEPGWYVKNE